MELLPVLGAGWDGRGGGNASAAGVWVADCGRRPRGGHDDDVIVDRRRLGIAVFFICFVVVTTVAGGEGAVAVWAVRKGDGTADDRSDYSLAAAYNENAHAIGLSPARKCNL